MLLRGSQRGQLVGTEPGWESTPESGGIQGSPVGCEVWQLHFFKAPQRSQPAARVEGARAFAMPRMVARTSCHWGREGPQEAWAAIQDTLLRTQRGLSGGTRGSLTKGGPCPCKLWALLLFEFLLQPLCPQGKLSGRLTHDKVLVT